MFKFVLQFLILFLLFIDNKKAKGGWLVPTGIILGLYALSALMAIFCLYNGYYVQPFSDSYWLPMIYFDIFILLFLLPFRHFNEKKIQSFVLPSRSFLDVFSTIVIALSIFSMLFYGVSARNVLSMADLGQARNNMVAGESYFEAGILATIGSVAAANYVFAIMLYFIYKMLGEAKIRCVLLFISSFSETIQGLAFVGRDGIVFWFFTFAYMYAFFRPFIQEKERNNLVKKAFIALGIMSIPFFLITISRFSDTIGTGSSMVSYLGQGFVNGPLFWGIEAKPVAKGAGFPLYYEITGISRPVYPSGEMIGDWASWHFSTFVVSLYRSLDLEGLIIVAIVMYLLFIVVANNIKSDINLGQLTFIMLYFQIIGEGVFYFKHSTRGGNLFIISTLILAVFFSLKCKNGKRITVNMIK